MALLLHKWLLTGLVAFVHPFFVSVTEINYNAKERSIEISCKTFTDDLENSIQKTANARIDIFNPRDSARVQKAITDYIRKHLVIKVDGKPVELEFIGFEREELATWSYFEVPNIASVKKLEINNTILHEASNEQINLMHVTVNNKRKSLKVDYPDSKAVFEF